MTIFLRYGTHDFFLAERLEKPVRLKLLDTSHSLIVNANVLTGQLENGCYPVSEGFSKCLGRQSPEDVREGVVRGCVPIELPAVVLCVLPPQIVFVLLNVQLKLPLGFIPRHKCGKGDQKNVVQRVNKVISLAVIRNGREDGEDTFHRATKLSLVIYTIDYQLLSYKNTRQKQAQSVKFQLLMADIWIALGPSRFKCVTPDTCASMFGEPSGKS